MRTTTKTCTSCGTVHPSDLARALGRFGGPAPAGYRAIYDGAPVRATREEAEQDACAKIAALLGVVSA